MGNELNDTINRQAAIDVIEAGRLTKLIDMETAIKGLKALPSAQKKGHWICVHPLQEDDPGAYICSECKLGKWGIDPKSYFFCPNCGADMRGEQDETN